MKLPLRLAAPLGLALALVATPEARAQDIYLPGQLSEAPRVASLPKAARLIRDSYPAALLDRGVGGTVQLEFVVRPDGSVDPASIKVVSSSVEALGAAARDVARRLEFTAPKVDGDAVHARVLMPLIYQAN